MDEAKDQVSFAKSLRTVYIPGLIVLIVTCGASMLGGMIGSLVGADLPVGVGAISGASLLGIIALIIACCATNLWSQFIPALSVDDVSYSLSKSVPNAFAPLVADHAAFTLIVTVVGLRNVHVGNRWGTSPNLFVEIDCGSNPIKRSCISQHNDRDGHPVFNEQFRVNITPQDNYFTIYLKDQTLFGSTLVAYRCVDIGDDILQPIPRPEYDEAGCETGQMLDLQPFPTDVRYNLQGGDDCSVKFGDGKDPRIVLSFGHTSDFGGQQANIHARDPVTAPIWNSDYGSVSYLSKLQFNQDATIDFSAAKQMQKQQASGPSLARAAQQNAPRANTWAQQNDASSVYVNV